MVIESPDFTKKPLKDNWVVEGSVKLNYDVYT